MLVVIEILLITSISFSSQLFLPCLQNGPFLNYIFNLFTNDKFEGLLNPKSLQMTIPNLMKKWQKVLWKGRKHLGGEEKVFFKCNFSFSHSVFKRLVLQARKNQGLFGKGFNIKNAFSLRKEDYKPLTTWYPVGENHQNTLFEKKKMLTLQMASFIILFSKLCRQDIS